MNLKLLGLTAFPAAAFNWSALIVFLVLAVVGIWVSYCFLNKTGLYLFCILSAILVNFLGAVNIFGFPISLGVVIMPIFYFALLFCYNRFGKQEAIKLFLASLIVLVVSFICMFFQAAYIDAALSISICLTWDGLGGLVSSMIAISVASFLTMLFIEKVKVNKPNKFVKNAIYVSVASVIDSFIFVLLIFTGRALFGNILLVLLIRFAIGIGCAFGIAYFEKYLNRKLPETKADTKQVEPAVEKKEETAETEAPKPAADEENPEPSDLKKKKK